ncbi:hypothetical protein Tco_1324848 [Tanacetum coccineum]
MATEKESFNALEIEDDLFTYDNIKETGERCANHQQYNKKDTSKWHVCKPVRVFYDNGSGEDCGIWPTCNPDLSFCSGYEAVYGKEWLKVKIRHTSIENSDQEKVLNKWYSFDVEADYAKMFANPYSRRFDEYKRIFINKVEQLSNEYELRIGKKGYVLDDVWEKCKQNHEGTTYAWHDEGHEEEEL